MPQIATKTTRVTLDSERIITSSSCRIDGIKIANGTASNIVVQFLDNDNNNLLDIAVLAHDSGSWGVTWIAENGLKISSASDSSVVATVAHSADGV